MPRNAVGAFVLYAIGLALAVAGAVLFAWTAFVLYDAALAFDWARSAAVSFPVPVTWLVKMLIDSAARPQAIFVHPLIATVLLISVARVFAAARIRLRPADMSDDGTLRLELKKYPPRVGENLAGKVSFITVPSRGEVFRLALSCTRDYSREDEEVHDVAFSEQQDARPTQDIRGWSVPFSFAIPTTTPSAFDRHFLEHGVFEWRLAVYPANSQADQGASFGLKLRGAARVAPVRPGDARAGETKAAFSRIGVIASGLLAKTREPEPVPANPAGPLARPAGSNFQRIVLIAFAAMFALPIMFFLIVMIGAILR